eukprot:scaffold212220_cov37-Tisochrysis_lutea.AAC.1
MDSQATGQPCSPRERTNIRTEVVTVMPRVDPLHAASNTVQVSMNRVLSKQTCEYTAMGVLHHSGGASASCVSRQQVLQTEVFLCCCWMLEQCMRVCVCAPEERCPADKLPEHTAKGSPANWR